MKTTKEATQRGRRWRTKWNSGLLNSREQLHRHYSNEGNNFWGLCFTSACLPGHTDLSLSQSLHLAISTAWFQFSTASTRPGECWVDTHSKSALEHFIHCLLQFHVCLLLGKRHMSNEACVCEGVTWTILSSLCASGHNLLTCQATATRLSWIMTRNT